jgi:anti-sigma regulatory factor (Ser/Thr protein kinase)
VLASLVMLLTAVRFYLTGAYELSSGAGWKDAAGIIGLVLAAVAPYAGLAFELEDSRRATLLPTLRRGRARRALAEGLADEVTGVHHEAGVRRQLWTRPARHNGGHRRETAGGPAPGHPRPAGVTWRGSGPSWEHCRRAGLSADRTEDMVIAVNELAANTLRHTDAEGSLHIWSAAGDVTCQVQDTGHIDDPLAGRVRPSPDANSGQGLWVVNQVSDLVELHTGRPGTTIRLHMRLTAQRPKTRQVSAAGRRPGRD